LLDLGTIEVPLRPVIFIMEGQELGDGLLILFEKNVIFDLKIFSFGEFELDSAEVVLEARDFHLISVDFPHIKLDIVTSW
jgi:hypothetical protein